MKTLKHTGKAEWTGYTFDQLIYERAVTLARSEMERQHLEVEMDRARQGNFLLSRSTFSKVLGLVSFTDFIVIGVKIWRALSPIFSKKKK